MHLSFAMVTCGSYGLNYNGMLPFVCLSLFCLIFVVVLGCFVVVVFCFRFPFFFVFICFVLALLTDRQ